MSRSSQQMSTNSSRGTEVFVGGLAHTITEDKIHELFSACGEIMEIRLIKDKKGNSKGYCFVRFARKEAADKAVKEISGFLLDGKEIGVLPSMEQDTLFLGNLNKGWNAEEFENFVRQVFPDVVSVNLVMLGDVPPGQKQQNRGFGFVKFSSHADKSSEIETLLLQNPQSQAAARAYRAGSLSTFVLAGNVHPSVKWAEEEPEISPEELAKIKIAFVRHLPATANENYLKELFEPFGKVDKVVLSRKGNSQVGFVYFDKRQDLDNAIKIMNEKTVQGPNGHPAYKLQVEVARPMDKKRKRAPEDSQSKAPSKIQSHSTLQQDDLRAKLPGVHVSTAQKGVECADPYEDAVVALPIAIKERLLRILRLGIATRFDIDVEILASLKELPESNAISVLDQFMLSGAEMEDKGAYLTGLISRHLVDKVRHSQLPASLSRVKSTLIRKPELSSLSSREPPAESFVSHFGSIIPRSDVYTTRYSLSDNYLSSRMTLGRVTGASVSPLRTSPSSSLASARIGLNPHSAALADQSLSPFLHTIPSSLTGTIRIGLNSHETIPDDRSLSPLHTTRSSSTGNARIALNSYIDAPSNRGLPPSQTIPSSAAYSRVGLTSHITDTADRRLSPGQMTQHSSRAYGRLQLQPDGLASASRQLPRHQVRFDPFTGEPYRFDPFTGEPILPESSSSRFRIP